MITVITPFSRKENLPFLIKNLQGKCNWIVLQASEEPVIDFPDWVIVKRLDITAKTYISNRLFNAFISEGLESETQYMILNDDDLVEEGFFEKIPNEDVVVVSMKRGDEAKPHRVWDAWPDLYHIENGVDILEAKYGNMQIAKVGGEQMIIKGKILRNFRYGLSPVGDGKMVTHIFHEYGATFVPDAYVLFNYLEDGRFKSFRRKPQILFIGDYYCAGRPQMGISEWETNIWKSLESTDLADVAQFHYDKYWYHFNKRGDEALIQWVKENKPDYAVIIVYKQFDMQDPTAINLETIQELSKHTKLISIWGDLEAEEQVTLAKQVAPYCYKVIGTASEECVTGLGYIYKHVPKDPRIFNNPKKVRDIDVLFNGSFGYGREERREVLQYLVDNGIKLVAGGSEGGDHFTTEEYANRYKRAKISIGFSRARGKDVINARCFEAMLCGSLYLVQESEEMKKLYDYQVHFDSWANKEELLQKVRLLLSQPVLCDATALCGQMKTERMYSALTFWKDILI